MGNPEFVDEIRGVWMAVTHLPRIQTKPGGDIGVTHRFVFGQKVITFSLLITFPNRLPFLQECRCPLLFVSCPARKSK